MSSIDVVKVATVAKKWERKSRKKDGFFPEPHNFHENVRLIKRMLKEFNPKMNRLRELDLIVFDNSIRETTVGQVRGHTLEDKMKIFHEVKNCDFKYCIIESFHHMTRLGDLFVEELKKKGEDMSSMFAFSELIEKITDRVPQGDLPIGLSKSEKLGIKNVIIEVDLMYYNIDYKVFNAEAICQLILKRLQWMQQHLGPESLACINFRDFAETMKHYPSRVFKIVNFVSSLKPPLRPFALLYEELGKYLPEELGAWTQAVRSEMDCCGWTEGHLLVHVHQQWGMSDSIQLECLANGADGIWAGLCEEGAAVGHASSCVTIMNLVRMGNKKVQEKFNCQYLREAAQNVTQITTGDEPHTRQHVYGARALDIVFGFDLIKNKKEFDYAEFLGIKPEIRITELATPEMIVKKLKECFGENAQFNLDIGTKMMERFLENLRKDRKEESNSKVGLAMLFDQSGGTLTDEMSEIILQDKEHSHHIEGLIKRIRKRWDVWDISDGVKDDQLTFDAFYNGFMAPYFGCYRCEDSRKGLKAIDMDNDGMVEWKEFALYLKWAGRQYPNTKTADQLLDIAFRKGLIPAMQDEILSKEDYEGWTSDDEDDSDDDDDDICEKEVAGPLLSSKQQLILAAAIGGASVLIAVFVWHSTKS